MSDKRNKHLKTQIKRLTKLIGQATRSHDHNEASNLRQQRGAFCKALITEFDEYWILANGKSDFVSLEEAQAFYSDPKNVQRIGMHDALTEMSVERDMYIARQKKLENMSPEDVKKLMYSELQKAISQMEKNINMLRKELGQTAINFEQLDTIKNTDDLDGIDMSSLL